MPRVVNLLAAVAVLVAMAFAASSVRADTITARTRQNGADTKPAGIVPPMPGAPGFVFTANPFTFRGRGAGATLTSITDITVTLTIRDGDSARGNFDFNDLTLGLDGIDTGILLNGFRNGQTETHRISGAPQNVGLILAAMADRQLIGSVIDRDTMPGLKNGDNSMGFPTRLRTHLFITGSVDPTIQVASIPEPATMLLLGTGLAGVAAKIRRRRKN